MSAGTRTPSVTMHSRSIDACADHHIVPQDRSSTRAVGDRRACACALRGEPAPFALVRAAAATSADSRPACRCRGTRRRRRGRAPRRAAPDQRRVQRRHRLVAASRGERGERLGFARPARRRNDTTAATTRAHESGDAPSASTTMPPYFSGSVFGTTAIVTRAPDCRCAATSAPMSTSVSVSPLTIRNVDRLPAGLPAAAAPGAGRRRSPAPGSPTSSARACRGRCRRRRARQRVRQMVEVEHRVGDAGGCEASAGCAGSAARRPPAAPPWRGRTTADAGGWRGRPSARSAGIIPRGTPCAGR